MRYSFSYKHGSYKNELGKTKEDLLIITYAHSNRITYV